MNKRLVSTLIGLFLILLFFYFSGYRLSGLSAARANSFIPKDAVLLDQVNFNWGSVYIFDSKEKPLTAVSNKKYGFLWVSRTSTYYFHDDSPVQTLGGVTVSEEKEAGTVFSAVVHDPNVASIEAGPEGDRQRKYVSLGTPITFSWDKYIQWSALAPKALDQEGTPIYEYRYAQSNHTKLEDLKWYPITR